MRNLEIAVGVSFKDKLSTGLRNTADVAGRAASAFRGMGSVASTLGTKLDTLKDKAKAAAAEFSGLREQADRLQSGGMNLALKGTAAVGVTAVPTFQAMGFEQGFAEVATLTDMSVQELQKKYGKQILGLAADLGQSEGVVVSAMYQAISAGVSADKAVKFLEGSGKAAIGGVTDILTATDLGTTVKNAFGVAEDEMGRVWDIIFQTVKSGKTDMRQIAGSFSQVGSAAAVAGLSLENVQAAVAQLTLSGDPTSTAYTKVANTIAALSSPTEGAKKAFSRLGVVVNAETLKNNDLVGTLGIIADKVQKLPFKRQAEYIAEMFGDKESQNLFKDFIKNRDNYVQMVDNMENSSGAATAAAEKMMSTTAQAWSSLKQTIKGVAISMGSTVLPAFATGARAVTEFMAPVLGLIQAHPKLAGGIMVTVAGLGAMAVVLGVAGMALGGLLNGYATLRTVMRFAGGGFKSMTTGINAATAGIRAFNISMLASPVGLAIGAIVVGAALIYKYWAPISGFFRGLWTGISEAMQPIMPQVRAIGAAFMTVLSPVITPLKWIYNAVTSLLKPVDDVGGAAEALGVRWGRVIGNMLNAVIGLPVKMFEAGANIVSSIWQGIKSMASKPVEAIAGITDKIRNYLPFSPAKEGALRDIHKVKLVETVASGIKADSLVRAVDGVMTEVRPAFDMGGVLSPASALPERQIGGGQMAAPAQSGGDIYLTYSPTVTVQGGGQSTQQDILAALREHSEELLHLIETVAARKARLAY